MNLRRKARELVGSRKSRKSSKKQFIGQTRKRRTGPHPGVLVERKYQELLTLQAASQPVKKAA